MAAPVAGCLYGQAIRLTAVPFNGVVYHSRFDARNRSYPSTPAPNDTLVGLRRSLAGIVRHNYLTFIFCSRLYSLGDVSQCELPLHSN
jgi:hypothetical protein